MSVELPYDPFLYLKASNEGVPLVTGSPRSTPAERLMRLSAAAFGEEATPMPDIADDRKPGGLFRFRR
jgi:MinD-like ATPase involved in chromosome partitioning or flagellar assembly